MDRFISYSPICGGSEFDESAKNFMDTFLQNLRIIRPNVIRQNLMEGFGLISFDVYIGKIKKIRVFVTNVGITILKEELDRDSNKWIQKDHKEITNEYEINYENLLN